MSSIVIRGPGAQRRQMAPQTIQRRVDRKRFIDIQGQLSSQRPWPFSKEPAAGKAENTAPHTVQVNRHHRRIGSFNDLSNARLKCLHMTGTAERTFRKYADHLARLQRFPGGFKCTPDRFRIRKHQNGVKGVSDPLKGARTEITTINDEANIARQHP